MTLEYKMRYRGRNLGHRLAWLSAMGLDKMSSEHSEIVNNKSEAKL